jgi:large subunit ribosomal protein L21
MGKRYHETTLQSRKGCFRLFARHFPTFAVFAVVDIAGFQEKVALGDQIDVPLQASDSGKKVVFGNVLLIVADDGAVSLGTPFVSGASVEAEVIRHGRGEKIRVFKFRRRKRHMNTRGHKQSFTTIKITKIAV